MSNPPPPPPPPSPVPRPPSPSPSPRASESLHMCAGLSARAGRIYICAPACVCSGTTYICPPVCACSGTVYICALATLRAATECMHTRKAGTRVSLSAARADCDNRAEVNARRGPICAPLGVAVHGPQSSSVHSGNHIPFPPGVCAPLPPFPPPFFRPI